MRRDLRAEHRVLVVETATIFACLFTVGLGRSALFLRYACIARSYVARLALTLAREAHRGTDKLLLETHLKTGAIRFAQGSTLTEDLVLSTG